MAALKVRYKEPQQLKPRARNPRTHTAKQPSRECRRSVVAVGAPRFEDGARVREGTTSH